MLKLPRASSIVGRPFNIKSSRISGDVGSSHAPSNFSVGGFDSLRCLSSLSHRDLVPTPSISPPGCDTPRSEGGSQTPRSPPDDPLDFDSLSCSSDSSHPHGEEGARAGVECRAEGWATTTTEAGDEGRDVERVTEAEGGEVKDGKVRDEERVTEVEEERKEGRVRDEVLEEVERVLRDLSGYDAVSERTPVINGEDESLTHCKPLNLSWHNETQSLNRRRYENDSGFGDWVVDKHEGHLGSPSSLTSDTSLGKEELDSPDGGTRPDILARDVISSLDKSMKKQLSGSSHKSSSGISEEMEVSESSHKSSSGISEEMEVSGSSHKSSSGISEEMEDLKSTEMFPASGEAAGIPSDEVFQGNPEESGKLSLSRSKSHPPSFKGGVISMEDFEDDWNREEGNDLSGEFIPVQRRRRQRGASAAEVAPPVQSSERINRENYHKSHSYTSHDTSANHCRATANGSRAFSHRHNAPPRRGSSYSHISQSDISSAAANKYSSGKGGAAVSDTKRRTFAGCTIPRLSKQQQQQLATAVGRSGERETRQYERNSELSWIEVEEGASTHSATTSSISSSSLREVDGMVTLNICKKSGKHLSQGNADFQRSDRNCTAQHRDNMMPSNHRTVPSTSLRAVNRTTSSDSSTSLAYDSTLSARSTEELGTAETRGAERPSETSIGIQCDLEQELEAMTQSVTSCGAVTRTECVAGTEEEQGSVLEGDGSASEGICTLRVATLSGFSLSTAQTFIYTGYQHVLKNLSQDSGSIQTYG